MRDGLGIKLLTGAGIEVGILSARTSPIVEKRSRDLGLSEVLQGRENKLDNFRDFLAGKLDVLPGEKPTLKDFNDHLTTAFPEVRLKKYLEMRGASDGAEVATWVVPLKPVARQNQS